MTDTSHQEFDKSPIPVAEFSQALAMARQLIQSGDLTEHQAETFSDLAASQFWAHYLKEGVYLSDAVRLLCEVATRTHPSLAWYAQRVLFSAIVEPLSDAFDPAYGGVYDRLFAEVIDWCRHTTPGAELDVRLSQFGLYTARDLVVRRQQCQARPARQVQRPDQVQTVFLLSRVTLGAEVAITGTLITKVLKTFANAQCVLLVTPSLHPVFAESKRLSVRTVPYDRNKNLIDQFKGWLDISRLIPSETEGLRHQEYLVVDPDSRLTQLGMLPVLANESNYLFFESRTFGQQGTQRMGQLANDWANQVFGGDDCLYPTLSLSTRDWEYAETLRYCLRETGAAHAVVVNFGVGGNPDKRLSEAFEYELVSRLIDCGSRVLLAEGVDREEIARSHRLLTQLAAGGREIKKLDSNRSYNIPAAESLKSDVVAWRGNVGTYCALIGTAEEYIGYDSGGQHVAAALGTPTIDIFAHSPYPLFAHRWQPYGPGRIAVVDATGQNSGGQAEYGQIVQQIMTHHQENKAARRMGTLRLRQL